MGSIKGRKEGATELLDAPTFSDKGMAGGRGGFPNH